MKLADLLFLFCALAACISLLAALLYALRRRWAYSISILQRLAIACAAYLALVATVGLLAPQRILAMQEDQCSDDWCLAVGRVNHAPGSFEVVLRVSSRARRVTQSARDAHVYILDETGRRYDPLPADGQKPLASKLAPGESFLTPRVFDLPDTVRKPGLVVAHGEWPGRLIVGDSQSFLHKPSIVSLQN